LEDGLGMLMRLFPRGDHRSIGTVSAAIANFHRDLGRELVRRVQPDLAAVEFRQALRRYDGALAVFEQMPENTSFETRLALAGRGRVLSMIGDSTSAANDLGRALAIAERERCKSPASVADAAITDLLDDLASAADKEGNIGDARRFRDRKREPDFGLRC